jgi:hypothetical protein
MAVPSGWLAPCLLWEGKGPYGSSHRDKLMITAEGWWSLLTFCEGQLAIRTSCVWPPPHRVLCLQMATHPSSGMECEGIIYWINTRWYNTPGRKGGFDFLLLAYLL